MATEPSAAARARPSAPMCDSRSVYTVDGLTCGSCLAEVMEAVRQLPNVTGVAVDLMTRTRSSLIVSSDVPLEPTAVITRVATAGFRALPASKRRAAYLQRTFTGSAQNR